MTLTQSDTTATRPPADVREVVLDVRGVSVEYGTDEGQVQAVDGASFSLRRGERLALVGESGCGKTTLAMALMRLTRPPGRVTDGQILLDGNDILQLDDQEMRATRLAGIALVQQGAMNSLNPVLRVQDQMIDALQDHGVEGSKEELRERVGDLLVRVGLTRDVARMYPHELSGGMKQPSRHRNRHLAGSEGDCCGRADQRVGRSRAKTGDGDARPASGRVGGGGNPGRPRHGTGCPVRRHGGRDVRRKAGGGGAGRTDIRRTPAPIYKTPD